jgi:hypothetical protein
MAYDPPDYGGYDRQKADTQYKYSSDSTTNAYGRFLSQQRGERNLGDKYRAYGRNMPKQQAGLAQRGIAGPGVGGGAMQQSMGRFVGDFARDYGRTQQDNTEQLQNFDMNQANLDQWRESSMAGIEADKQRAIALDAQQLEYLRQLVGGA